MKIASATLMFTLLSTQAFAADDHHRTIDRLGVQSDSTGGNLAYISAVEGWSSTCQFGVVYLELTTDWARAAYASALAAKLSGKRLSRVVYDIVSGGRCVATLVEILE